VVLEAVLVTLFALYVALTCCLILHTISLLYMFSVLKKHAAQPVKPETACQGWDMPFQLVQLPIYNEDPEMVKALIDSACSLKYESDLLLIQVLDDSDREEISKNIIEYVSAAKESNPDLRIEYLHRPHRTDYKAGNLNYGLHMAKRVLGDRGISNLDRVIVSIFDADFLIPEDFLQRTVGHFGSPEICAVQASIRYTNTSKNHLTRVQSTFLSNLHSVAFAFRSHTGHLTTFLGSAGSWRLSAIEACGGWPGDTQIEDVDLSIAAQLKGFRILYIDDLTVLSHLPESYSGFKLQQRSWMKGIMEIFKKHIQDIMWTRSFSPLQKMMAAELFLILSLQPLYIIAHHILALPAYFFLLKMGYAHWMGYLAAALVVLFNISHIPFLQVQLSSRGAGEYNARSPYSSPVILISSICISLGMFATFSYGIAEGLLGFRVHRESTQKGGLTGSGTTGLPPSGRIILGRIALLESALAIFSIFFAAWAALRGEWAMLLLYGPFALGYPWMVLHFLFEMRASGPAIS